LNPGDILAVFASDNDLGDHVIIGIHQGVFRIEPGGENLVHRALETKFDRQAPMTLVSLREQVFRATGRPWTAPPKLIVPSKTSKPFGAAAPDPTMVPSAPASPPPTTAPESGRTSLGMFLVGLLIVAAVVAVFVLRKSKAESNQTR
jgi:hypothetical protein